VSTRCALVVLALAAVLASACDPPAPDFTDPKTTGVTPQDIQKKTDIKAYVLMERAIKKVESARNLDVMPEETRARLASEAATARKYDQVAQDYGRSVEDIRVVSTLREGLANYLDRLSEFALATKIAPKVSPLSAECWTSDLISSQDARERREQLLNRAQLALGRTAVYFSRNHGGSTATADTFKSALISGASLTFFEVRGIERPSIEQMEEVYKKEPVRSEFLAFGHCVFWMKGDFTNSIGPAT
jgi:hypothetical protein